MNVTVEYSALAYLSFWWRHDRAILQGFASSDSDVRLKALETTLRTYKIVRQFSQSSRQALLAVLERQIHQQRPRFDEVSWRVEETVESLPGHKNLVSAASKLLWQKFRSPIVIYDGNTLSALCQRGHRLKKGDYAAFLDAWHAVYDTERRSIESACARLADSLKFCEVGLEVPFTEVRRVTSERWFQERVFDRMLWFEGIPKKKSHQAAAVSANRHRM